MVPMLIQVKKNKSRDSEQHLKNCLNEREERVLKQDKQLDEYRQ